jgi:hypothetical protein
LAYGNRSCRVKAPAVRCGNQGSSGTGRVSFGRSARRNRSSGAFVLMMARACASDFHAWRCRRRQAWVWHVVGGRLARRILRAVAVVLTCCYSRSSSRISEGGTCANYRKDISSRRFDQQLISRRGNTCFISSSSSRRAAAGDLPLISARSRCARFAARLLASNCPRISVVFSLAWTKCFPCMVPASHR